MRKDKTDRAEGFGQNRGSAGFTLVELTVVLAILAILAALGGTGLSAYLRLARFRLNEAAAGVIFQAAELALAEKQTAGERQAFLREVTQNGRNGIRDDTPHFRRQDTEEAGSEEEFARRNTEIYALFYDRADPTTAASRMVAALLGPYIYDESLLDASLCLEVDGLTGQVYAVFYDANADRLRFGQNTNIENRSLAYRRSESLVGYCSAHEQLNAVTLAQSRLRVQSAQLVNGETLRLVWRGNSTMQDLDTAYTITLFEVKGDGKVPLYRLEVLWSEVAPILSSQHGIATLRLQAFDAATGHYTVGKSCNFPLSYSEGSFALVLDAMADANLLRAVENDEAFPGMSVGDSQLYSVDRLLQQPAQLQAEVSVSPLPAQENEPPADGGSAMTNIENSHFAAMERGIDGATDGYTLTYYRHLYNTRWMDADSKACFTLAADGTDSHFDWYSGEVVLYTMEGAAGTLPIAVSPSRAENPDIAWPTLPVWGRGMTLTNSAAAPVTLQNLQLRGSSVAARPDNANGRFDSCLGLIGENRGVLEKLTLAGSSLIVNVAAAPYAGAALNPGELLVHPLDGPATLLMALPESARDARPHLEAVGTVCGRNTGTLQCIEIQTEPGGPAPQLLAAVPFTDAQRTAAPPQGVGGIVGVAVPQSGAAALLRQLSTPPEMTVAGLLMEKDAQGNFVLGTSQRESEQEEKIRYSHAAQEPAATGDALWRAVGVGGIAGVYDVTGAAGLQNAPTDLANNAAVVGSGFTGGVAGSLYTAEPGDALYNLTNTGTVAAGIGYKTGSALGQFFGGVAGYARSVTLQGCTGRGAAPNAAALTAAIQAGFDPGGILTEGSPLQGDFVGGLLGFGKNTVLDGCGMGPGCLMGRTFVGGLVGGSSGSVLAGSGGVVNLANVFGHRYVGGTVAVNGGDGVVEKVTNRGLVAALGTDAAYLGGIAAVNDSTWGEPATAAVVRGCANLSGADPEGNATNEAFLREISEVDGGGVFAADFVGGIVGCNGSGGILEFAGTDAAQVNAVLYGGSYVGGIAGVNAAMIFVPPSLGGCTVSAAAYAGGIAGVNSGTIGPTGTAEIANLAVDVTAEGPFAGGAVGYQAESGLLYGLVHSAGDIQAADGAGGLAGGNAGTVSGCGNTGGTVSAAQYAGGIVGHNTGLVENSWHSAMGERAVYAANGCAGGIAGYNGQNGAAHTENDPALLASCTAAGSVTAATGEAGGITAHNRGTILGGGTVQATGGCAVIYGTAQAIGAVAACNEGSIREVTLVSQEEAASRPQLAGAATRAGALVGSNSGTVQRCEVQTNSVDFGGLTAHGITLGGAVGENEKEISHLNVTLDITENTERATDLGGVVGGNHGTLMGCSYAGRLGDANHAAARPGSTLGGLAGYNIGTVRDSTVQSIRLDAQGVCQTAADTPNSASHVGGAVGRNAGAVEGVVVAATGTENRVAARCGFVGGVCGSNEGSITASGGRGTQNLLEKVKQWMAADDTNAIVAALKTDTEAPAEDLERADAADSFQNLRGSDTAKDPGAVNDLIVTLGGTEGAAVRGNGCLGGLAGWNAAGGVIAECATGRWFVYGDNLEAEAAVGGAIGLNETERELETLVNCAAVRRLCRTQDGKEPEGCDLGSVGGLLGVQRNRTSSGWKMTDCINCGSVFHASGGSVGGVVSRLTGNGGEMTRCFNFGLLTGNTIGGIAGCLDKPAPGASFHLISCQNHGSLQAAEVCAGLLGKVVPADPADALTLNLMDCVNAAPALAAGSLAVGVFGEFESSEDIPHAVLNIDRCRSYTVRFDCVPGSAVGICGGGLGGAATTLTDCFALYNEDKTKPQYPICGAAASAANVAARSNYYMDACSFDEDYIAGLLTLGRAYNAQTRTGSRQLSERNAFGRLLFAGRDNGAGSADGDNNHPYFGADVVRLQDTDTEGFRGDRHRIVAPGGAFFDKTKERFLQYNDENGTVSATLPLLFDDANPNDVPDFADVTDEAVRNYYTHLLGAAEKLATPETAATPAA